jgi:putative hydrolase of the HAD superfamily
VVQLASDPVKIEAVLFDFRGTLFDDEDETAWIRNSAASIGRELDDAEIGEILERLGNVEHEPEIAAALERCDISLDVHRAANLSWYRAAGLDDELALAIWSRDGHPEATFAFSDSARVMAELREHGIGMAVMSDIHFDVRDHFRRHDLDRFVDAYVLSYEHGIQKPDAAMFTLALDALGVTATQALMVGDTPANDGGAAQVGIATFILPGPFQPGRTGPRGLDAVLRLVGIA